MRSDRTIAQIWLKGSPWCFILNAVLDPVRASPQIGVSWYWLNGNLASTTIVLSSDATRGHDFCNGEGCVNSVLMATEAGAPVSRFLSPVYFTDS